MKGAASFNHSLPMDSATFLLAIIRDWIEVHGIPIGYPEVRGEGVI